MSQDPQQPVQSGAEEGGRRLSAEQIEEIRQSRLLLHHFFSILRTAAYHSSNNVAMQEPSEKFAAILSHFLQKEQGPIKLEVGDGQMFINVNRVRPSERQRQAVDGLGKFFKRRGLGGLLFKRPLHPDRCREILSLVVAFKKPLLEENGMAALTQELAQEGFGEDVEPVAPVVARVQGDIAKLENSLGEVGQLAMQLSRGVAMVKATVDDNSEVARAGTRHVVRQITDLDPEVRDAVVGLSMLGASDDMAMRSLTVLLVAVSIAEELEATRVVKADLGQACIELANWDRMVLGETSDVERPRKGVMALQWLAGIEQWSVSDMRQGLALAARYLPARMASPVARILRVACDYVDLTTPSPLHGSDPFLNDAPMAPHEALAKMHKFIGQRYSAVVIRALVDGVGLLPVGTPVEMADGHSAIVVERTDDPVTFIVQDTLSKQRRQAGFRPGPNQILRVVTGGDLLKVRSNFLLGDDHTTLQKISERMVEDAELQ